jgi:glycosyltransferase involved in cell wall biosynthesis
MLDGSPWPRVSIVTPSYNQAQFIEETIRSVLLQGYPDLEYIIIDGSSIDGSVDIIRKYQPWLTHWVSEKDRGQSHAINRGFARAEGEVVAWLNSDDLYTPQAVGAAVSAFSTHSRVGVIYGDCHCIDAGSRLIFTHLLRDYDLGESIVDNYIAQPATFFRRTAVQRVNGLDESLHYALDFDLWIRLGLTSEFHHVPVCLACFRAHDGAKSSRPWTFVSEIEFLFERLFERADLPPSLAGRKHEAFFRALAGYAVRALQVGEPVWARELLVKAVSSMPDFAHRSNTRQWFVSRGSLGGIWDTELVQALDCLSPREGRALGHMLRASHALYHGRLLAALREWSRAVRLAPTWALTPRLLRRALIFSARLTVSERCWQRVRVLKYKLGCRLALVRRTLLVK